MIARLIVEAAGLFSMCVSTSNFIVLDGSAG